MDRKWVTMPILIIFSAALFQSGFSEIQSALITSSDDFYVGGPEFTNTEARQLVMGKEVLEDEISLAGGVNCAGALATDGEYLYVKCWGDYGDGTSIAKHEFTGYWMENIVGTGGVNKSLSMAYLDGYLYNGYSVDGKTLDRVDVTNGEVRYVRVPDGLVCASTGVTGNCGTDLLITSDGSYLYNLAYNNSGSDGSYHGWVVKKFDSDLNRVDKFTINEPSFYVGGLLADGDYLYAIEWAGAPDARIAQISLADHNIVKTTRIDQHTLKWINGQYDFVNKRFLLGDLLQGTVYVLGRPGEGLVLSTDSSTSNEKPVDNEKMILYYKINGECGPHISDETAITEDGNKIGKVECVDGKFGDAAWFDGYDDRIETAPDSEFNDVQDLSVEMWVMLKETNSIQGLFSAWYNATERIDLVYVPELGFALGYNISGYSDYILAPRETQADVWYHVAFSISSANEWKVYVNGRLVNSTTEPVSAADLPDEWNITLGSIKPYDAQLCVPQGQSECDLNGFMDQIIVYNTVLAPAEVADSYLLGKRYITNGGYVSKKFQQEKATAWTNFSWDAFAYDGRVDFFKRTSDHADESWTEWSSYLSNPSNMLNDSARFIQFKAEITSYNPVFPVSIPWLKVEYEAPDTKLPVITHSEIKPKIIYAGQYVNITINATDESGIAQYMLNITNPDGKYDVFYGYITGGNPPQDLVLNHTYNYSTYGKKDGTFTVKAFVKDIPGNEQNITLTFYAMNQTAFNLNVTNTTGKKIAAKVTLYYPGTDEKVEEYTESDGEFKDKPAPDYNYDIVLEALDSDLVVTLKNVDLSANLNRQIVFDRYNGSVIYFVNTTYEPQDADLRLSYDGYDIDEDRLKVFSCDNWLFTQKECAEQEGAVSFSVYTQSNYVDVINVGSLITTGSAFIIKESWCGDGVCSVYENATTCPDDCETECVEGDERPCSIAYQGKCAVGNETCIGGTWSGCPSPGTETCNGIDDNCDGIIDNTGGGSSIEETRCGCYNGAQAFQEECNGIDDDCDGQIDEGAGCCLDGDQQPCGSNTGECEYGTKTCIEGIWGSCVGGVQPITEICFDHKDNDCDGEVDENCEHCNNNLQDYDEEGVDCGGDDCSPCAGFPWWILIVVGVVIIGMLLFLMKSFKEEGKELTWEELKKKYTPAQP